MRRVINGIIYDTEKSELVFTDMNRKRRYYVTPNNRYFVLFQNGLIEAMTEDAMKDLLGTYDIDKYIELFGEPIEG